MANKSVSSCKCDNTASDDQTNSYEHLLTSILYFVSHDLTTSFSWSSSHGVCKHIELSWSAHATAFKFLLHGRTNEQQFIVRNCYVGMRLHAILYPCEARIIVHVKLFVIQSRSRNIFQLARTEHRAHYCVRVLHVDV